MAPRRVRLIAGAILVVALALRLGYVLSQRGDVLFDHPVLDEERYVAAARALVGGHGEARPYWQPPGIVYALVGIFELAGDGLLVPRLVQVMLSVASCGLVFLIGRRLFDERVGLGAAAILAVHGVLVFECNELLPATWIVFLDLVALWLVLRAVQHRRPLDALAAGLAIGVSAVFAPTILAFGVIAAILVRRPLAIAALIAGLALPIVPIAIRNYDHGGELVPVSTNAGLNLYLGNNADYRATFALRPGRHWEELTTEPARHGIAQPGAASSYFVGKALDFVTADPLSAIALVGRKLYLFFHGAEIPRDTDLYAARDTSALLGVLVWPRPIDFPDGLLVPVALLGIAALARERRRLAVPLALLATLAVTTAVFFVSSRHRAPALPLFALFAAAGAGPIVRRWKTWTAARRAIAVAGVVALVVLLDVPTWETELSYAGEADFYRGLAATDPATARDAFRRATEANPDDARAWFELGNVLDRAAAIDAWQHAAALDPFDGRARRRIAQALVERGDLAGAGTVLEAAIATDLHEPAYYAPDHLNLAFIDARLGRHDAALAQLDAAARADRAYVRRVAPRMMHAPDLTDRGFVDALAAFAGAP